MLCLDCVRNLFSMRRRYDCNVEEEFAAASRASFLSPPRAVAIDAPEPRRAQSIAESLESEAAREVEELKNVITDLYKQNKLQRECHRKKQRRSEPLPAAKPGVDAAPAVPGTARRVSWQNRVKFHILAGEATPTDFSSGDPPKEPSDETFSQEITAGNGMAAAAAAATAASIFMKQASQPVRKLLTRAVAAATQHGYLAIQREDEEELHGDNLDQVSVDVSIVAGESYIRRATAIPSSSNISVSDSGV